MNQKQQNLKQILFLLNRKKLLELKKKYEELEKAVYSSQKLTDKIAKELI